MDDERLPPTAAGDLKVEPAGSGRHDSGADPLWPHSWFRFFLLPLTWMFVLDPRGVSL